MALAFQTENSNKGSVVKEFEIETYGEDMTPSPVKTVTLMGLRVFCEQEMYVKIHSGEFQGVLIVKKGDSDETLPGR